MTHPARFYLAVIVAFVASSIALPVAKLSQERETAWASIIQGLVAKF